MSSLKPEIFFKKKRENLSASSILFKRINNKIKLLQYRGTISMPRTVLFCFLYINLFYFTTIVWGNNFLCYLHFTETDIKETQKTLPWYTGEEVLESRQLGSQTRHLTPPCLGPSAPLSALHWF